MVLKIIWDVFIVIGALSGLGFGLILVFGKDQSPLARFGGVVATPFLVLLGALAGALFPIVIVFGIVAYVWSIGGGAVAGEAVSAVSDEVSKSIDTAAARQPQDGSPGRPFYGKLD